MHTLISTIYNNILDLAFDQNNNIMMFGDTRLEDQNGTYSNAKFWLFKIDTNGNKIFEKKFGDGYCFPIKIINTKNGKVYQYQFVIVSINGKRK